MHFPRVEYLEWDRALGPDLNHIGASGVPSITASEMAMAMGIATGNLDLARGDLPLDSNSDRGMGSALAKEAIAARYGFAPEQVYPTEGTSLANFLAAAALLDGGGHAVVEEPVYTPLLNQIEAVAARVDRVPRPFADKFRLDPEQLARVLRSDTRVVAITELHNPSGVRLGDETLRALAERCARVGAHLLVDEVYRDFLFDEPPASAASLAPNIVATSSLTKVYGLGGLRLGWILGPPAVIARAARINLHLGVLQPGLSIALGVRALGQAEALRERARRLLAASWPVLREWVSGRGDLEIVWPEAGSVVFPRWRGGDTTELAERLLIRKRTVIVPGRFFLAPWGMRLAATAAPDRLRAGLDVLAEALEEKAVSGPGSRC